MTIQRIAVALIGIGSMVLAGVALHEAGAEAEAVPAVLRAQAIELVDSGGPGGPRVEQRAAATRASGSSRRRPTPPQA